MLCEWFADAMGSVAFIRLLKFSLDLAGARLLRLGAEFELAELSAESTDGMHSHVFNPTSVNYGQCDFKP
ncbi:hypothetical protein BpHYR1_007549 [Brachionus plicatilis]|uniref:Uncharacterized protein n=1 Tax=Brachionus plicatilis TaxID=10195 RepID=A0A3M7S271_BRAPC|nr:hypothetical protein BpHYR1_007549 [Brachionus plicatilis]